MRLLSVHPKYLDARGLVALWREGLLAQAVLRGQTNGYLHHPQLERFRTQRFPLGALADYLRGVHTQAASRGYAFAWGKISRASGAGLIAVSRGQIEHEWNHLMAKLATRDPGMHGRLELVKRPRPHPLFRIVPGGIEKWEKGAQPPPNNRLERTVRCAARR